MGEVLDLFLPRSVNVPAMLEHTDRARTEYRKILSAFIEQLRMEQTTLKPGSSVRETHEWIGRNEVIGKINSKIDDMLK